MTEAAVRAVYRVATRDLRRRLPFPNWPNPATVDPRLSVAAMLLGYTVLAAVAGILAAGLLATHQINKPGVSGALLFVIGFCGAGGVVQATRIAVVAPILHRVPMGSWKPHHTSTRFLAYPNDLDLVLQAVVVLVLLWRFAW